MGELDRWLSAAAPTLLAEPDDPGDLAPFSEDAPAEDAPLSAARDPAHCDTASVASRRRRPLLAALAVAGAIAAGALAFAPVGRHTLAPHATASAPAAPSIDPQARERYLDGLHAWNLRTPASLAQAREDFGAAIAREPGYAPAYAGLANTYLLLREFGAMPEAEAYTKALAAAETALRLDPNLAAAHRARAFALFWGRGQPDAAWAEFEAAARLAPTEALTWHWYATALDGAGRSAEAARMIDRARALDPASTAILADKGVIVYRVGRQAEGRALEARVLALDPANIDAHRNLARMAMTEGRRADADAGWARVVALGGNLENRSAIGDLEPVRRLR